MKTIIVITLSVLLLSSCGSRKYCNAYGHGWSVNKHTAPHD